MASVKVDGVMQSIKSKVVKMIEKLSEYKITKRDGDYINADNNTQIINKLVCKINELVDAVNDIIDDVNRIHDSIIKNGLKPISISKEIDPYEEQRKWRGKLCRFWDDSDEPENCVYGVLVNIFDLHHEDCPFQCENGEWYEYCEPIKPDDDIIYKGGKDE